MPKVSIIIPLYNKAPYVKKALDSVCAQTYTDWECVIVDDGSTDGGETLAEQLIRDDSRFRVLHQTNAGVSVARNNGVLASQGEYLCFLDADDWWAPEFLEKMLAFADMYPEAGLWASNYIYYKPGKTRVAVHAQTGKILYPRLYLENVAMPVWTGATMLRRDVFFASFGFPAGIQLGEDFLLWSRIAMKYPVAFLNEPLAYYNNDVPASLRATRNLYAPEHHMLWHLTDIESMAQQTAFSDDWSRLFDWLRVTGLQDYWLSKEYHDMAAEELRKVDWNGQSADMANWYNRPLWQLRIERYMLQFGTVCKQKLNRILR